MNARVGIGFDVHRLVPERALHLGGVEIPFSKGLIGWSDGDAPVHAIIDALLGAAAMGNIGTLFPPGDPKYENISSLVMLRETRAHLEEQGWQIGNVDVTIIVQEPKLSPYVDKMRDRISESLGIAGDRVGIKAKTADGLGSIGQGEGIAACAVALVRRPNENP